MRINNKQSLYESFVNNLNSCDSVEKKIDKVDKVKAEPKKVDLKEVFKRSRHERINESDVHHTVPDYCKEGAEEDVYDDRQLDVRSAQFNGDDFVVESRQELNEEVFDKIVKRLQYHFNYWGIEYDSIEDNGNSVVAIGCYMPDAAYKEYIANSDSAEDEVLTINGQTFKDVSDAKAWLDEKIIEYGNTYFFPDSERNILNKLIEKFGNTYFWK
jgi:hypothetical protein